jgi:uncharacterized protein YbjT (DUF2867 family)
MSVVLVTGATGTLGRHLLARPARSGHLVRAMSRRGAAAAARAGNTQWVRADLATGEGLDDALRGVEVVIHAASDPRGDTRRTDVEGTTRLVAAALAAGVRHLVYVSIVGVDRIPIAYYRIKLEAEEIVRRGGVPWTIVRGTQFHEFVDTLLRQLSRSPVAIVPAGFVVQPIDVGDFADELWRVASSAPVGRAPDVGGPEVLAWRELLREWLAAQGMRKFVLSLPIPGRAAAALRRGEGTAPANARGGVRWSEWVRAKYAGRQVSAEVYP